MLGLLWLIPALPAAGFVALVLLNRRLSRSGAAWIGAGSVGLSALVALLVCGSFIASPPAGDAYHQVLWTWMDVAGFAPTIGFYLDAVSVLWVLVITFVGFLIHLYSTEHMEHDEGFTRFFMYLNLFVASMLVLVLADNLLLLYLGWEGVGLCSYLLISFWQKDPQNVYSGRKAFIVTRVGDTALIAGLFLLFTQLHTLQIQPMLAAAQHSFVPGSAVAVAAALLILGGAVGKSAQVPLQTWLPDAMAGPSPVSALIHAATMVTAGVYLIARTNVLFTLAPDARLIVAIVGTVTLLLAGFSALVQHDLKRALAYSTISQIGYMFLALGVSGWEAGVFHFMTHAFFKALLFLAAGVIIEALADEHDIFKMGGLARELPGVFWTFTIGAAALAALPFVTDGFYSKDLIIATSLGSVDGSLWFYVGSLVGAFVTALYSFRLVFLVFFGERHTEVSRRPRWRQLAPLYVLATLSIVAGFVWMPGWISGFHPLENFLNTALPQMEHDGPVRGLRRRHRRSVRHHPHRRRRRRHRLAALDPVAARHAGVRRLAGDPAAGRLLARRLGLRLALRAGLRAPGQVVRACGPQRPRRLRGRRYRLAQRRRLAHAERRPDRAPPRLRGRRRVRHRPRPRRRGAEVTP